MVFQGYQWKVENVYPVDAQDAGEFIKGIEDREGVVTADRVLDESRPKEALLHACFEWDDPKAAEAYRLYQSRKLIGNLVKVTAQPSLEAEAEPEPKCVRAFLNVSPTSKKGRYRSVETALADEDNRNVVLENARMELRCFRAKYSNLLELSKVFDAIDEVLKQNVPDPAATEIQD